MSLVDSATVFEATVREYGLAALMPKFLEAGWETFNDFAFWT